MAFASIFQHFVYLTKFFEEFLVENDSYNRMRVIDAGSGYLCQMEPVAHFGLGSKSPSSMTIEVRWPDGVTRSFDVSNQINKQFTVQHPSVCNGSNFCS